MAKTKTKTSEENTPKATGEMFIENVKLNNDNTCTIFYKTSTDKEAKEVYYSGKDPVTQEFYEIFQATVEGFCGVIPRLAADRHKITMNKIKLDYDKQGFLKNALYSVKYAFNDQNNAVVNISTPLLPIYKEGMENTFTISGKHETALHDVIEKAKAYMNGDTRTKQMKLVVDNTDNEQ